MSDPGLALLEGAIDIHVHTGPDIVARKLSDHGAAAEARAAGMRGLVIKSHVAETAARAQIATESSGAEAYGALVLNHFVGGLNADAASAALRLGAKVIFMPTFHAAHHQRQHRDMPLFRGLEVTKPAISLLDERGRLVPGLDGVLAEIAAHDATLATGHVGPEEIAALTTAAFAAGVRRVILTHPLSTVVNMSVDQAVALAQHDGVFVEHCYVAHQELFGEPLPLDRVIEAARRIGADKTILSSDGGQARNPLKPVEMLRRFAVAMVEGGIAAEDVRRMVKDNPARALGLSA